MPSRFRIPPFAVLRRLVSARRAIVFASLLLWAASAPAQALRVMTFNVRLAVDSDGANRWEARRDLMAETIRKQAPDVFGTQELFQRQGDDLAARLPQYAWFGRGRRDDRSVDDEHMGVFYRRDRLRVLEHGDFWLSDTPEIAGSMTWGHPLPRMVTWARFERVSDGRRFTFFNTHLAHRDEDDGVREKSAALILRRVQAVPADEPVIVVGDFNTVPGSRAYSTLTAALTDAWLAAPVRSGPAATFHDFTGDPDRRIDWILLRGPTVKRVRTLTTHRGERYPSDHFPVVAELALPEPPRPMPPAVPSR